MTRRAQSEVLGFILVFALIVSLVLVVSLVGLDSLEETRDAEEINNAERAFDVLADNMADIHEEGAPSRATEISLESAQLETGDNVKINVTVINKTGATNVNEYNIDPIVFTSDDTDIVYSAGAILRDSRDGGLMIKDPPFQISEDRVVLPIVQTQNDGDITSTSGNTIRIRAVNMDRRPIPNLVESPSSKQEIILTITSPRSGLWKEYLDTQGATDDFVECPPTPKDDNIRCSIDSSDQPDLYVSTTLINYFIEP